MLRLSPQGHCQREPQDFSFPLVRAPQSEGSRNGMDMLRILESSSFYIWERQTQVLDYSRYIFYQEECGWTLCLTPIFFSTLRLNTLGGQGQVISSPFSLPSLQWVGKSLSLTERANEIQELGEFPVSCSMLLLPHRANTSTGAWAQVLALAFAHGATWGKLILR